MNIKLSTFGRSAVAASSVLLVSAAGALPPVGAASSADVDLTPARASHKLPPVIPLPSPEHFVARVDNPYLPWVPHTRWVYRGHGSEQGERDVVQVLARTKQIQGITATVVRDEATDDGVLIERTFDWYAQDECGNVWYLGENTKAYEDGTVDTEGSWETGVDGAQPGIAMLAHPAAGDAYRQEFYRGHAEDIGRVLDIRSQAGVAFGHFRHVVLTKDTSALEPRVEELKFYAPGVGSVLEMDVSPDQGSSELVRMVSP